MQIKYLFFYDSIPKIIDHKLIKINVNKKKGALNI